MPTRGFGKRNFRGSSEYLIAGRRKIEMARYHLECLQRELSRPGHPSEDPPIPVQAHFEGIMYAVIAASDQTAEGINKGFGLGLDRPNLRRVLERMSESGLRTSLSNWQRAPILADVREIRRLATHHNYVKAPGALKLEVQRPFEEKPYGGSRGLVEYGTAAVEHVARLRPILDELEREVAV